MNRRILVIVAAMFVLALVAGWFVLRPGPTGSDTVRQAAPVARAEAPAPRVADAPAPLPDRAPTRRAVPKPDEPASPAPPEPVAEAPPEVGTLRIDSDVPGAQVFLDRQFIGATPVTAQNVAPGTHQLNVSAEGFDGIARSIDVEAGPRDVTVRFREVSLNARIDVVHKHRVGSCRGQLVATPQGIRYETDDKEDRFSAQLMDLDTFKVDYLEKNLKVQPRKGKQYNFTDPAGNADHLFVFHRDVDKVRERLKRGDQPAAP